MSPPWSGAAFIPCQSEYGMPPARPGKDGTAGFGAGAKREVLAGDAGAYFEKSKVGRAGAVAAGGCAASAAGDDTPMRGAEICGTGGCRDAYGDANIEDCGTLNSFPRFANAWLSDGMVGIVVKVRG